MYICIHNAWHTYVTLKEQAADMETAFEEGIKAAYDEIIYILIHIYTYVCI